MRISRTTISVLAFVGGGFLWTAAAQGADRLHDRVSKQEGITQWNRNVLSHLKAQGGTIFVEDFSLEPGLSVKLELKSFRVTSSGTRIVVGRQNGDVPLDFDASNVKLFRGTVVGEPYSSVFLATSERLSTGYVQLYNTRYLIYGGADVEEDTLIVFRPTGSLFGVPVQPCGLDVGADADFLADADHWPVSEEQDFASRAGLKHVRGDSKPLVGMQLVELAVDTDFEYFDLFGDLDAAAEYVVMLYGAVSDTYMRDVGTRIELSFVRLFDKPEDEPAFMDDESPISGFRSFWNDNMNRVPRDVAQFLTGRRNLPYGGVAYLNGLCNTNSYSVAGYILGAFPSLDLPSTGHWDVVVTAHELGHNFGTGHTHDYGIDNCAGGDVQRGTIMSYCTIVPGGVANIDLRLHSQIQVFIESYVGKSLCVVDDCNFNSVEDTLDIAVGDSDDQNGNNIPDECEDCNENGVLDDADIASGTSQDVNGNAIPDECEADCDGNGLPDAWEVSQGQAEDLYGHGFPDLCDPDCDSDGISDYNEIQGEMSLDINRNIALDDCEDCDGDGLTDMEELDGAHNAWIASLALSAIGEFHAETGVRIKYSDAGAVIQGTDVIIDPEGRIFVASAGDHRVAEFDRSGAYLGDFVAAGSGGLSVPAGLAFGPQGDLFVSSSGTDSVLRYHGLSGRFIGIFVATGDGGLSAPTGLTFGPNGDLFVSSSGSNEVLEFDGSTGNVVGVFVSSGSGGLGNPKGLAFKADGHLLVASHDSDAILEYDGRAGEFTGRFDRGGPPSGYWALEQPWGLRLGPDGDVYVASHQGNAAIHAYDAGSGLFLRSFYILSQDGLPTPTGFDFMPGWDEDCNVNHFPDECDIASGTSLDNNKNGVPDECECPADFNGDAVVNATDLAQLLGAWGPNPGNPADLNGDDVVDAADLAQLLGAWGPCL